MSDVSHERMIAAVNDAICRRESVAKKFRGTGHDEAAAWAEAEVEALYAVLRLVEASAAE